MNIDDLLNKYFDGETSVEEEQRLRAFFVSEKIPQRLDIYKPLFAYFDEEIRKKQKKRQQTFSGKRKILYSLSGIAASLLLLLGIKYVVDIQKICPCSGNYVLINGHCYTDMDQVRLMAFEALQEVATPASEYFPGGDLFNDDE